MGEDVVYDGLDHVNLQADGPALIDLAGSYTLDSFSKRLDEGRCGRRRRCAARCRELYRRWAFESAALDLALAQAGRSLADVLGREPRPLNFVVSMRLGAAASDEPEKPDRVLRAARALPGHELKLDPTNHGPRSWWTSWWRPARSTRSTSRASTRARRWTWRPTPSCTGW